MSDYSDAIGAIRKFTIAVAVIVLIAVGGCGIILGRAIGSDRIGRMDAAESLQLEADRHAERVAREEWIKNAPVRAADALQRIAKQGAEEARGLREEIRAIRDELKALRGEVLQIKAAVNAPAPS